MIQIIAEPDGREFPDCFSLRISEDLVRQGIFRVTFRAKENTYLHVYVHQNGQLFTQLPGIAKLNLEGSSFTAAIEHEIIKLLNYNGEECNSDTNYNLQMCREEYIYQVSIMAVYWYPFFSGPFLVSLSMNN